MVTERPEGAQPRHGGDLDFATATYGAPPDGWVDLSTGVSPYPYPVESGDFATLDRLPAPHALADLIAVARAAYAVPAGVDVIAVPGTEMAIRLMPLAAPTGTVAIVAPTYASHAEAWTNAGRIPSQAPGLPAAARNAEIVVLANPNNPDGRITALGSLRALAVELKRRNGLLVVDEAFADVAPAASIVASLDKRMSAVVLRSFGKFFGLPGLRLGFAIGALGTLSRLAGLMGDWAVSSPAIAIGTAALRDAVWQEAMRLRLSSDAARLRALLAGHGLTILGGTDLFVLVEHPDAEGIHRRLAWHGIWTRIFAGDPTWLRLGLPPDNAGYTRLDAALSAG